MNREFEKVISENLGRIRYIASRYSLNNEFEDVYQEILMQLWRSFESYKGNAPRETWLYKVALNTACTFASKSIKQKELQQALSCLVSSESQPGQENCQANILNKFMDSLSDIDASVLMMYLDGMSSDEIADVTGITGNAVRSRIKRIKSIFENKFIGEPS